MFFFSSPLAMHLRICSLITASRATPHDKPAYVAAVRGKDGKNDMVDSRLTSPTSLVDARYPPESFLLTSERGPNSEKAVARSSSLA